MKITERDIAELQRENILLQSTIEKQKATIDYLSMMTEIPLYDNDVNTEEN